MNGLYFNKKLFGQDLQDLQVYFHGFGLPASPALGHGLGPNEAHLRQTMEGRRNPKIKKNHPVKSCESCLKYSLN